MVERKVEKHDIKKENNIKVDTIENFEKPKKSKISKEDSENKFSDTFKIRDFEVFDEFPSENRGKSKSSIDISKNEIKISLKFLVIILIVILITGISIYYFSKSSKNVAAKINGEIITLEDLDKTFNTLPEQYKLFVTKKDLLEQLIQAKVFYLEAKKEGIIVSKDEAKTKLDEIRNLSGLSNEEFLKNLNEQNTSEKELVDNYVKQLTVQKFIEEKLLKDINVSEEELKEYYKDNNAQFKISEQVVVSHILIRDTSISSQDQETKAKELLKRVNKDNFCENVKQYSADTASIDTCGEYKFTKDDPLVQEFKDLSFKQKVGEIGIVKTQYGWHIVWTKEKIPAKTFSFDEAKNDIQETLKTDKAREKYKEFYEEIAKNYKITINYKEGENSINNNPINNINDIAQQNI